ncbi:ATP-binding protein [Phaeobacter sp. C3_T13_0]|uniref:ATP-binding protein n=1 Tax=Phaeobacter cretensis TaxID=3342641 RepID=UPI0039BC313C
MRIKTTLCGGVAMVVLVGVVSADPIRMTYEEYPPYSFTDIGGQPQGVSIDLMRHIADAAGREVVFQPNTNPAGMLGELRLGAADVTSLLALTPERLAVGLPTTELGSFEMRAFALRSASIKGLADLEGREIGVVSGSFAVDGARKIPDSKPVEFPSMDTQIVPFLTGEIDVVVSGHNSFLRRLRMAEVEDQVRVLSPPLISSPYGFVVARDQEALRDELNAAIATSVNTEVLISIQEKWFGRSRTLWDDVLVRWGVVIAAVMFAAILTLGYWFYYYRRKSRQLQRDRAGDQLLIGALDEVSAAIVIYDQELKAIHWNHGFEQNFPGLLPALKSGATMQQMIVKSYTSGIIENTLTVAEITTMADGFADDMLFGRAEPRIVRTNDGRVFQAREVKLGPRRFASLRMDITQLQEQQDTIVKQAVSLEAANEELRTLSSIAAHDLKGPLFSLLNLIDFIAEDMKDAGIELPGDVLSNWTEMEAVSKRMMQLVQDLLVYTTTQSESDQAEVIEPSTRLKDLVEMLKPFEGFSVLIEPDIPQLLVNSAAFDMVMRNLIANALRHHDRDRGHVIVNAVTTEKMVTISVRDDGPGIPEQHHERIFAPFHRLSSSTGGSGLGLAFIKRTVESWGGAVRVTAAQPRGAVFEVCFPRSV